MYVLFLLLIFEFIYSNGYNKQVPVTFEVSPYIAETIITDEEWLWQMLLNLLTNACKYTDRGGIQVKVSLTNDNSASTESVKAASTTASIATTATVGAATITAGTSLLVSGLRAGLQSATSSAITDIYTATQAQNHFLLFEVIDTGASDLPLLSFPLFISILIIVAIDVYVYCRCGHPQ